MKNLLNAIFFGSSNKISGLAALIIVGAIALGCTCNKKFDFGNLSNSGSSSPTPPPFNSDDSNSSSNITVKSTPYSGKKADASKLEIPADGELQQMVKKTLLDFNDAVARDDFTDFYANLARPWKRQITPDKLRATFSEFVTHKADIGTIRSLDCEFSPAPAVATVVGFKTLKVFGKYRTSPMITKFELNYIPEGKEWKLSKIDLDTTERNQY